MQDMGMRDVRGAGSVRHGFRGCMTRVQDMRMRGAEGARVARGARYVI